MAVKGDPVMQPEMKINIAHITQYLVVGGLETFIVEFCKKADRARFNLSVLCLNGYDDNYRQHLEQHAVPVSLVKKRHKLDLSFFAKAARILRSNNVEVIHIHGGCFFYGTVIGKIAGVRSMVYTAHGMPITFGLQERIEEFLSFSFADKVIAVSKEIAADYKARLRPFRAKVETIINGIDTDRFIPKEDTRGLAEDRAFFGLPSHGRIIGAVGRLDAVKNYPLLLRAVAELVHSLHRDVHLVLVGGGREEPHLRMLASQLGIGDRVFFLGMQYDLPRIYPLFDLYAMSSLTEGTSLALLEAQSCGIPAVATDVGGNPDIIRHGVNGLLFKSGDLADLTAKLDRLLCDDRQRLEMKKLAREVVLHRFNMGAMLNRYQQIYGEFVRSIRHDRV